MVGLADKVQHLYPASVPLRDWLVTSVGGVETLAQFNLGAPPTQVQLDAVTQPMIDAALLQILYAKAKALLTADDDVSKKEKAVLVETLGLCVAIAGKFNALQAAIAAASSLADLKTRAAAVGNAPTPTIAQAKVAIGNRIDAGQADG